MTDFSGHQFNKGINSTKASIQQRHRFNKDFIGCPLAQENEPAPHEIANYFFTWRMQHTEDCFFRDDAEAVQAFLGTRIAGDPDNASLGAGFDMADREDQDTTP